MRHHGKWKRRRARTTPVFHRTLHRIDMERDFRHEEAANGLRWLAAMGAFVAILGLALAAIVLLGHIHFTSKAPGRNSGCSFHHPPP